MQSSFTPIQAADPAPQGLPEAEWLARCAARLVEHDREVAPDDAREVAAFMYLQNRWRQMDPQAAADAVFDSNDQPVTQPAPLASN